VSRDWQIGIDLCYSTASMLTIVTNVLMLLQLIPSSQHLTVC